MALQPPNGPRPSLKPNAAPGSSLAHADEPNRGVPSARDPSGGPGTPNARVAGAFDAAAERDAWHGKRLASLQAPDGWLSLVGLHFLSEGTFEAGSGDTADFRHANCLAPVIGRFVVAGNEVRFLVDRADLCALERVEADGTMRADDAGPPSIVRSGSVSFALVRRNGRLALRVRDNLAETRVAFKGIELFPFDPAARVEATFTPAPPGAVLDITNVTGHAETQELAGRLDFRLAETAVSLQATKGSDGRLFVVFGDRSNGAGTYGGGRFLDVPAPSHGRTVIDFNRAYNPPCSFTAFATCPLPPSENRLPFPVLAGERKP